MAKGLRARLSLALPLVAALVAGACGGFGSRGVVCPGAPSPEALWTPAGAGDSITYGFLIDRAYTGDVSAR